MASSLKERFLDDDSQTQGKERSEYINPHINYLGRPIILGSVEKVFEQKHIRILNDGAVGLDLPSGESVRVSSENQYNRVLPTMDGLMEDLIPGTNLADNFSDEWKLFEQALIEDPENPRYGTYVYYPVRGDLVQFAPSAWHKIARLARNSLLLRDPEQKLNWQEQRDKLGSVVIGVAGASVGKNAFLQIINTIRPEAIKIGDNSRYKDTNANRTSLAYWELGRNKAETAALQAHQDDPFINISVYSEGIHDGNVNDFLAGNQEIGEPPVDIIVEETDDPEMKIKIRQLARQHRKEVFMITDLGVAYQVDYRNYKDFSDLPLAVGIDDNDLLRAYEGWKNDRANRALFFEFAFKLIGEHWQTVPEFRDLVLKKMNSPFAGGIPQLGSAAFGGAAHVSVAVAQHTLGHQVPERVFVDPRTRRIIEEGSLI